MTKDEMIEQLLAEVSKWRDLSDGYREEMGEFAAEVRAKDAEIERLTSPTLEKLEYKPGSLDMSLSGPNAMTFMNIIVDIFESNGGKNFLSMTLEAPARNKRYGITIENLKGELSAAEKMKQLETSEEQAKAALAIAVEALNKIRTITPYEIYWIIIDDALEQILSQGRCIDAKMD